MLMPIDDWDATYRQDSAPPWDIGRPQPAIAKLADQGAFVGRVLDGGCGTGENALLAAAKGASVVGIDLSETAILRARKKARSRGLEVEFEIGDIFDASLGSFDTLIDCGLFHLFDDAHRTRYVEVIGKCLRDGGHCYLMCFSDRQPGDWGPRRVHKNEIEDAFSSDWTIEGIEPENFQINPVMGNTTAAAWLAVIRHEPADR
jgi:SAM-dependent methyltransferase